MRKLLKHALIVATLGACTLGSITIINNTKHSLNRVTSTGHQNCEAYWYDSDYTSLNQIIKDFQDNSYGALTENYKTWGTVSKVFTQNSYINAYIENTGLDGEKGGVLLYQIGVPGECTIKAGDFVEVYGKPTWYNGICEFICSGDDAEVVLNSDITSYGIEPDVPTVDDLRINKKVNSEAFYERERRGTVMVHVESLHASNLSSTGCTVTYMKNDIEVISIPLYFSAVDSTSKTAIRNKLMQVTDGSKYIKLDSILQPYNNALQFNVKSADEITIYDKPVKPIPDADIAIYGNNEVITVSQNALYQIDFYVNPAVANRVIWILDDGIEEIDPSTGTYVDEDGAFHSGNWDGTVYASLCLLNEDRWYVIDYVTIEFFVEGEERPNFYDTISFDFTTPITFNYLFESQPLSCVGSPENAKYTSISYSVDDPSIAYVDGNYNLIPLSNGTTTLTATAVGGATTSTTVTVAVEVKKEIDINFNGKKVAQYTTNFDTYSEDSNTFGLYRGSINGNCVLYPSNNLVSFNDLSLPGAFNNVNPINNITEMSITYKGDGYVKFGTSDCEDFVIDLPSKSTSGTYKFDVDNDAAYFSIEATEKMTITEVFIKFSGDNVAESSSNTTSDTRIAATRFSGTLVDGVSKVDFPIEGTVIDGQYKVTKTKTYTYYSYDYVESHLGSLDIEEIAITEPMDIANYYIAFGCIPFNYVGTTNEVGGDFASKSTPCTDLDYATSIFGKYTRQVSQYNRTSGYGSAVPYGTKQKYLEFDFDGDGTYYKNGNFTRGSNRIVIWSQGWTNYNGDPTAVYTDDHYDTFREYLNNGSWGQSFKAQDKANRLFVTHGATNTISIKK